MTIGQSIKLIRKTRAKENQTTFAKAIGTGQAYLSQIENNNHSPSTDLLKRISEHVGVPLPILFWFGVEETDVDDEKLEAYRILKPVIDSMMNEIIK